MLVDFAEELLDLMAFVLDFRNHYAKFYAL